MVLLIVLIQSKTTENRGVFNVHLVLLLSTENKSDTKIQSVNFVIINDKTN